jgi:hypothetical protein
MKFKTWVAAIAFFVLPASASNVERFLGEWHGDSTCVERNTACRDEVVVYRVSKQDSGRISVSADKIVNGSPINMGSLEFRYDADRDLLICDYPQGIWKFKVDGATMEGTLSRPDNSPFRRVTLSRAKP